MSKDNKFMLYVAVVLFFLNPMTILAVFVLMLVTSYGGYSFILCLFGCWVYHKLWVRLRTYYSYYDDIYFWRIVRPNDTVIVERYKNYGNRRDDRVI